MVVVVILVGGYYDENDDDDDLHFLMTGKTSKVIMIKDDKFNYLVFISWYEKGCVENVNSVLVVYQANFSLHDFSDNLKTLFPRLLNTLFLY